MAEVSKTWAFDASTEGWIGTPDTNLTTAYSSGDLVTDLEVGAFNETGYWRLNIPFTTLGVPSDAQSISLVRGSYYYRYVTLNRFNTGSINFNIDGSILTTAITVNANTTVNSTLNEGTWIVKNANASDSLQLEFPINLQTLATTPAANRKGTVYLESITLDVSYTPAAAVVRVYGGIFKYHNGTDWTEAGYGDVKYYNGADWVVCSSNAVKVYRDDNDGITTPGYYPVRLDG